jgi:hypothetical protein
MDMKNYIAITKLKAKEKVKRGVAKLKKIKIK